MSVRSCADCGAPLEAGDTVCPLGHHSEDKLQSDLAILRAAVNDAFAAAESEVKLLTSSMISSVEGPAVPEPVAEPSALNPRTAPLPEPTASIRATVAELSPQKNPAVEKPLSGEKNPSGDGSASAETERSIARTSVAPPLTPPDPVPAPEAVAVSAPDPAPTPAPETVAAPDRVGTSAPVASAPAPPPPPPPPASHAPLFVPRPAAEDRPDDPIAAFAPAPRLDWGPDRAKGDGLRKRFNR